MKYTCRILPARLHLRQIHAHSIDARVGWQCCTKRLPPPRYPLADGGCKGVHYIEQPHHPCGIGKTNSVNGSIHEIQIIQAKIRSSLSRLEYLANDCKMLIAYKNLVLALIQALYTHFRDRFSCYHFRYLFYRLITETAPLELRSSL